MTEIQHHSLEEIDSRLTAIASEISTLELERNKLVENRVDHVRNLASANKISAKDCDDFAEIVAAAVKKAMEKKPKQASKGSADVNEGKKKECKAGCYSSPGVKNYLYYENKRGPKPAHAVPENWHEFTQEQLELVKKEKELADAKKSK